MTNDNDFTPDSIDDEFGAEVAAMLMRRSRDVPANPRPLPSLDRPTDPRQNLPTSSVIPLDQAPSSQRGSRQATLLAAAAALVLIAGGLFMFRQQTDSGAVSVVADDPTAIPAPEGEAEPAETRPPETGPIWTVRDGLEQFDAGPGEGTTITTSLDPDIQAASEFALRELPAGIDGITVTIDASTGEILGAARSSEGYGWFDRHSIGSSVHLYTLAAALDAGFTPYDLVDGIGPCDFIVGSESEAVTIENFGNSIGSVDTIQAQLLRSSRCGFAALEQQVGAEHMRDVVSRLTPRDMNSESPTPTGTFYEVDGLELSVIEHAAGLATLVNGGVYIEPTIITTATDATRNAEILVKPPFTEPRFTPEASGSILNELRRVTTYGTGTRAQAFFTTASDTDDGTRPQIAGVTGSDQEFEQAWFIGVQGRLVTAVLLLGSDGGPMLNIGGLRSVTGGSFPTETWAAIHGALVTHRLAAADTSASWRPVEGSRDPIAIGTAADRPPSTDDLDFDPSALQPPPPGVTAQCPSTHPNGIDNNDDGLIDVCYGPPIASDECWAHLVPIDSGACVTMGSNPIPSANRSLGLSTRSFLWNFGRQPSSAPVSAGELSEVVRGPNDEVLARSNPDAARGLASGRSECFVGSANPPVCADSSIHVHHASLLIRRAHTFGPDDPPGSLRRSTATVTPWLLVHLRRVTTKGSSSSLIRFSATCNPTAGGGCRTLD